MEYTYRENLKKISKCIGIIKRISHLGLLPKQALKLLYRALVHPYLTYCYCIWSSTYITHLTQLTRHTLQKSHTHLPQVFDSFLAGPTHTYNARSDASGFFILHSFHHTYITVR